MESGFNRQSIRLFDHLISERQQFIRHIEAERLRGLEVDDQLELGQRLQSLLAGLVFSGRLGNPRARRGDRGSGLARARKQPQAAIVGGVASKPPLPRAKMTPRRLRSS